MIRTRYRESRSFRLAHDLISLASSDVSPYSVGVVGRDVSLTIYSCLKLTNILTIKHGGFVVSPRRSGQVS